MRVVGVEALRISMQTGHTSVRLLPLEFAHEQNILLAVRT